MNSDVDKTKNFDLSKKLPLTIKIEHPKSFPVKNKIQIFETSKQIVRKFFNRKLSEESGLTYSRDENFFCIVFIEIVVISSNYSLNKITEDIKYESLSTIKNSEQCKFNILFDFKSIFIQEEDSNKKFIDFDVEVKKKDGIVISSFTESDLMDLMNRDPTENSLHVSTDRYDFIMENFRNLDNGFELFRKNILIFASAYIKYYNLKNYNERKGRILRKEEWMDFALSFGADLNEAENAFFEEKHFAYTILTLEEILREQSKEMNLKIEKYNRDLFCHNVKNLLLSDEPITDNDLWRLFAEYIRRDHFYDKESKNIYMFDGTICSVITAHDLRGIVMKFIDEVKSVKDSIILEEIEDDDEDLEIRKNAKNSKASSKCSSICNPFLNTKGLNIIKDSCAQYLNTEIKKGTRKNCVCFKDRCVVFKIINGKKVLEKRKAFMEDHFLFSTEFDLSLDFGKNKVETQALEDIEDTFKKMFVHEENILFFKCWLGSIYARDAERCGLFLLGDKKNAKSSIFNALTEGLGPKLSKPLKSHMFYPSGKGGVTCDPFWADAEDMIVGAVSEGDSKFPYSSVTFKSVTGGDMTNTAAKKKDPFTYKNTAKIAFMANQWIQFDTFDSAVISRLYPLRCIGVFEEEDPSLVPKTEEEQREKGIYLADKNFFNTMRKRALIFKTVTEYFDLYAQHGLHKTSLMKQELDKWKCDISDYAKFFVELEEAPEGEEYRVPISELKRIFVMKYGKVGQNIDEETFMKEFDSVNGIKSVEFDGRHYYKYKHKDIKNYKTVMSEDIEYTLARIV